MAVQGNTGSMWRGAATNKSIKGYGDAVVAGHKKGSTR